MSKNIYFNARIATEGAAAQTNPKFKASYSIDIPQGLVRDTANHTFSVIRFTTTLHGLPALFVKHPPGAAGAAETNYVFGMQYKDTIVTRSVYWSPADRSILPTTGDYSDEYWYEYNYYRMGTFVNTALSKLTSDLVEACPGLVTTAPFFQYDSSAAIWSLYYPDTMLDSQVEPVNLYCNEEAHHLFSGFPVAPLSAGLNPVAVGASMDVQFLLFQQSPLEQGAAVGGVTYYQRAQLPGSLSTWCPIRRLVLTTRSMGLVSEIISQVTGSTTGAGVPSSSTTQQKVFADFTPNLVRGDEMVSGTCEYQPTAQYRIVNFNDTDPVTRFDFDINWEDPLGSLHVLSLRYGGYASVKCDFIKAGG
jgi:hypothetical protein